MNEVIATGHLMRCISIADAAKRMGDGALFILADRMAVELLEEKEYPYIVLDTKWDHMDTEIDKMVTIIRRENIHKLFIDSYQVTEKYLRALTAVTEVVYLDDIHRFIYPVDQLICYANYAAWMGYGAEYDKTELFLGTKYTPLRYEFTNIESKHIKPVIENVVVLSGGADHYGMITRILEVLCNEKCVGVVKEIDVICGRYYQNYSVLSEQYCSFENVRIHHSVDNVADYMQKADIAISAGGVTLYELCACGTPTISFSFADNQLRNVKKFAEDQVIDYAGDARSDDVIHEIAELFIQYRNQEKRKERSVRMQRLVDGRGAMRIAQILTKDI